MKIKIIDLLNKRANGEQLPLQIKYRTIIYNLMADNTYRDNGNEEFMYFWREDINYILNDEVEITGEDKKIEKFDIESENGRCRLKFKSCSYPLNDINYIVLSKLNELIDEVNKLKENNDE